VGLLEETLDEEEETDEKLTALSKEINVQAAELTEGNKQPAESATGEKAPIRQTA
jgi:hypothetical protein